MDIEKVLSLLERDRKHTNGNIKHLRYKKDTITEALVFREKALKEGLSVKEISEALNISIQTLRNWQKKMEFYANKREDKTSRNLPKKELKHKTQTLVAEAKKYSCKIGNIIIASTSKEELQKYILEYHISISKE
jgi:transposase